MRDLSELPDGWREVRLEQIAEERRVRANSDPQAEVFSVTKHDGFVRSLEYFDRQVFSRDTSNYKVVQRGDLAYATIHLDEGSLGILRDANAALISPMYTVFDVDKTRVDPNFLFALMKLPQMVARYGRIGEGTVHRRKSISFKRLGRLEFAIPPVGEQRQIMAVLDAIDEAIDRTEVVISATERLRDALLQKLLRRGVPGWHTEWRSIAGVGTFPSTWRVARLEDLATLQRGADLPVQDREPGRIPVYGSNGILGSHSQALKPGPGVITGRSGSIGRVYFSDGPYWPLNTTLYVRDFHGNNPRFVYWRILAARLSRFAASTGVPSLNRNFVHPLPLAVPPIREQNMIALILDAADETVSLQELCVDVLNCLKTPVAKALLTGSVRTRQP